VALIDVPTLARQLAEPDPPTVIDVRFSMGGPPGRPQYLEGHIPGAAYVDLDTELSGKAVGTGGRHPLPDPADLQRILRTAGVRTGHPVVAYDGGDLQGAARLWWTLRWAGHSEVMVLDGGFAGWTGQGRPVEPGVAEPRPGDIVVDPGQLPVLDAAGAAELASAGTNSASPETSTSAGILLDARIGPRFRGETEPVDPVAGHIPGAVNLPAVELTGPDGRLRPPAELAARFAQAGVGPGTRVGAYCGSGVTAAKTVLALAEAGLPAELYVGSWSDWVSDPSRPVATGEGT
jgi:thiosulfate/3-mercaptopyruvate sulfurtransferase